MESKAKAKSRAEQELSSDKHSLSYTDHVNGDPIE